MIRTKRTITAILAAVTVISVLSVLALASSTPNYGDVNLDGTVSVSDASLIFRYCSGEQNLSDAALNNADVNLDGEVTREDGVIILKYVVGDLKTLPLRSTSQYDELEFINITFPEDNVRLAAYKSYALRGKVVSDSPILSVRVTVTDIERGWREVDETVEFSAEDRVYEFDMHSSRPSLDAKIKFALLARGDKIIHVYASDVQNESRSLFTGRFKVGFSPSELKGYVFNKNEDQSSDLLDGTLKMLNELDLGSVGGQIVSEAVRKLGTSYSEMDCSKFTRTVYQRAVGITLPSTAAEQARYCVDEGDAIGIESLKPGDLVFWVNKTCNCGRYREIHHSAIYLGQVSGVHMLIESVTSKNKVVIRPFWGEDNNTWRMCFGGRPR